MKFTVQTPTYNRAHTIPRLYKSLLNQTFKDFEWIINDDGSTDNTESLIQSYIKEGLLKIIYEKKPNGGKHTAVNRGAQMAKGELFFVADSDDYLLPECLERLNKHWEAVQLLPEDKKEKIVGVCGVCIYEDGSTVGSEITYDVIDTDLLTYRYKMEIKGDKKEAFLTSFFKKYPYPENPNEKFCPLAIVGYEYANMGYKIRYFNEPTYVVPAYLEGGITKSGLKNVKNSNEAILKFYAQTANYKSLPLKYRLKYSVMFWRFSLYSKTLTGNDKWKMLNNKILSAICYPIGKVFYLKDLFTPKS